MQEHILKKYDEELNKLRHSLLKMGRLVQFQIENAVQSLLENDEDKAKLVYKYEEKVDKFASKISKQGTRIFALHQPAALDLRFVLTSISINYVLELIGDLAINIAMDLQKITVMKGLINKTKFRELGSIIKSNAENLLKAYINMDNNTASEILKKNKEISRLHKKNFKILVNLMKSDKRFINVCSYLIDINRNLHSISRHMKSVAQELVFLYDSKTVNNPKESS